MYEIKQSNIHGLGVFATTFIPKDTKVVNYYGEEMDYKHFKNKYGPYKENSLNTYIMRRIWRIIVAKEEPYKTENIVNYINESSTPNCVLKKRALYTTRDVKVAEELTLKYPPDYKREYTIN